MRCLHVETLTARYHDIAAEMVFRKEIKRVVFPVAVVGQNPLDDIVLVNHIADIVGRFRLVVTFLGLIGAIDRIRR
jgi:hypothetical protein